jgi:hypothetical protein
MILYLKKFNLVVKNIKKNFTTVSACKATMKFHLYKKKGANKTLLSSLITGYDWYAINNTCVYVSNGDESYGHAKNDCESNGLGKLFFIDNENELNKYTMVREFIKNKKRENIRIEGTTINRKKNPLRFFIGLAYNKSCKYRISRIQAQHVRK